MSIFDNPVAAQVEHNRESTARQYALVGKGGRPRMAGAAGF